MKRLSEDTSNPELQDFIAAARCDLPSSKELLHLKSRVRGAIAAGVVVGTTGLAVDAAGGGLIAKLTGISLFWKSMFTITVVGLSVGGTKLILNPQKETAVVQEKMNSRKFDDALPIKSVPNFVPLPFPDIKSHEVDSVSTKSKVDVNRDKAIQDRPNVKRMATQKLSSRSVAREVSALPPTTLDESTLIRRAQDAMQTEPSRALTLLGEHRQLYEFGVFEQERDFLEIECLVTLGKESQAKLRGNIFLNRYPNSAYARRIKLMLKKEPK